MKILIVNTFYYPNMQGGAEHSVKLLAENLVIDGNEVAVYCGDSRKGEKTVEYINGVTVYRCATGKFDLYKYSYDKKNVTKVEKITQKLRCYYNPDAERDFEEICDDFKPEVVHTNTIYGIPWTVWKIAHQRGIQVVHTIRDTAIVSPFQYGHKENKWIVKAHRAYMIAISKYVDAVTAPSKYTLNSALSIGAFGTSRVKNRVFNSVQIDYDLLHKMIIDRKNRTSRKVKFLYAGRLIDTKGIRQMIEAFSKFENVNCELRICGTGELRDYIKTKSESDNRIIYCGKLSSEELATQYKECDVLIFPSIWPEPFGRVFIEGNMYGMPVIAGNCGGIPEIYEVTHGGSLCDCENIDELARSILDYCDRNRLKMYYDCIEKTIGSFDIDKQIEAFKAIYKKLIDGSN